MACIGESATPGSVPSAARARSRCSAHLGPGVCICDGASELCNEIIEERLAEAANPESGEFDLPKPKEIFAFLEEYVIGRRPPSAPWPSPSTTTTSACVKASITAADRPRRRRDRQVRTSCSSAHGLRQDVPRADAARKQLNVPFAVADATALTEAGYVGEDVENILLKLIQAADYDVKRAETGIIYIDEIDKIARKAERVDHARRVGRGRAAGAAEDP